MTITKNALNTIIIASNSTDAEIGGLLGGDKNGLITTVFIDYPQRDAMSRSEYHPDTTLLNEQIALWAEKDISFIGIFHSHFSGSESLSDADQYYICQIMQSNEEILKHLYFPVFVLPDNKLYPYKACTVKGKIVINCETLKVIQ